MDVWMAKSYEADGWHEKMAKVGRRENVLRGVSYTPQEPKKLG